jgi:hypothetical protein
MAVDVSVDYDDNLWASAVEPLVFHVSNRDRVPTAFKVSSKHPHRYVLSPAHAFVMPEQTKTVSLRVRAPQDLLERENVAGPMPILKTTEDSVRQKRLELRALLSGESGDSSDLLRVELRICTLLSANDVPSDDSFEEYWAQSYHHSVHMVPIRVEFLREDHYLKILMQLQEESLKRLEDERAFLVKKIAEDTLKAAEKAKELDQFEGDIVTLRTRAKKEEERCRRNRHRVMVPRWICTIAALASFVSPVLNGNCAK